MRILIAPNAMKGSLSATDFANAIGEGLLLADSTFELLKRPLADGGDGTAQIVVNALNGTYVTTKVHDPLGRLIDSGFGWIDENRCAIIEMAEASGLKLLATDELSPMITSSSGTGELILEALNRGAAKIILGIGGSATVDGGLGMMKALGFRLLDSAGNEISNGGDGLIELAQIETDNVSAALFTCEVIVATDVVNQLLGEEGAARIYGPQKGATPLMVQNLELGFENYIQVIEHRSGKDLTRLIGGGAAGGIAIPLVAFLNAKIVSGAELVMDLLGILNDLRSCDLVITGEGCIDIQTINGKGAVVIAKAARNAGIPVIAMGGRVIHEASPIFDGIFSICSGPSSLEESMNNAYDMTRLASQELGRLLRSVVK